MPTFLHGELSTHLPPLRLVSRGAQEYAGACPFCGGDERRSDRFHVWLLPAGRERYWCRRCNRKGRTAELLGRTPPRRPADDRAGRSPHHRGPQPHAAHIPRYRELYNIVATWAEQQLHIPWNPEPLAYLEARGFTRDRIRWARLGYALRDPQALLVHLTRHARRLLPFAEAAGVLVRDDVGALRTHGNLCGRIVIPYLSQGTVYDLRTRRFPGPGYTSLPGSYTGRGATIPLGWDAAATSDVVIVTEGEFKALAVTAAYQANELPFPALAHPGLTTFHHAWPADLMRCGVRVAILAYDTRPVRPRDPDGHEQLAPEEFWTIRHGMTLAAAGLQVLALRLPLAPGAGKEDLDGYLLRCGPQALTRLLRTTPLPLAAYIPSLPEDLVQASGALAPQRV